MGTKFSSKKDYNRVLANQPRTSLTIPDFDPLNNLQQPHADSFTIPDPVRFSQGKNRKKNRPANFSDEPPLINEYGEPTPQFVSESISLPPIQSRNLSTVVNNHIQQKSEEEQRPPQPPPPPPPPQQQIIAPNTSFSTQPNLPAQQQTMNSDPFIVSRSIIDSNHHKRTKNYFSSSFQSPPVVVERNGKQFLSEFRERTEQRYVQHFDEKTNQIRFFEVIDQIPYRIVQPYNQKFPFVFPNTYIPGLQSNQHPIYSSTPIYQSNQQSVSSPRSYGYTNQHFKSSPKPYSRSNQQSGPSQSSYDSSDHRPVSLSRSNSRPSQRPLRRPPPPPPPLPPSISNDRPYMQTVRSAVADDRSYMQTVRPAVVDDRSYMQTVRPAVVDDRSYMQNIRPAVVDDRSDVLAPSNPINNRNSINYRTRSSDYNSQHYNINLPPSNDQTPKKEQYTSSTYPYPPRSVSSSRSPTQTPSAPYYRDSQYSKTNLLPSVATVSKNVADQYSSKLPPVRTHTPTISDASGSSDTLDSPGSEEESESDDQETVSEIRTRKENFNGYDIMNPPPSYETKARYQSPAPVDPFARSLNTTSRHHYRQRPNTKNYAEPVANNRRFQKSAYSDYAPIPTAIKQRNTFYQ